MPLTPDSTTSPQTGRAKMSRSEAARHAANVRYGKEQPFAARLAAIREARKHKLAKGKGKGAKPKATPEQRDAKKKTEQTANVNSIGDTLDAADMLAGADAYDNGGEVDPAIQKDMVIAGLGEMARDGSFRLTSTGREALASARRGDIGAARDALSRGRDNVATGAERAAAGAAREKARTEQQAAREKAAADKLAARTAKEKQAEKEKAKSGGGGGKEKATPKTPADRDVERQQQRDDNRAGVQQALEKAPGASLNGTAFDALAAFADGGDADPEILSALADHSGLVERDTRGGYRMTSEGRAYVSAADRGNARAAGDAMSRALDRLGEQTQPDAGPSQDAQAERDVTQDRLKFRKKRQTWKALMSDTLVEWLDDIRAAKAQTAQERAMFANMGSSSGGGGGKGGGKKPSGGTGGLWPKGPDGKRQPPGGGGAQAAPKGDAPKEAPKADAGGAHPAVTAASDMHARLRKGEEIPQSEINRIGSEHQTAIREAQQAGHFATAPGTPERSHEIMTDDFVPGRGAPVIGGRSGGVPDRYLRSETIDAREAYQRELKRNGPGPTIAGSPASIARKKYEALLKEDTEKAVNAPAGPKAKPAAPKADAAPKPVSRDDPRHPANRDRVVAPVSGDMEALARFRERKLREKQDRADAKQQKLKIDALNKEFDSRKTPLARKREILAELRTLRGLPAKSLEDDTPMFPALLDTLIDTADAIAAEGDAAIKAGARHSAADMEMLQQIHDAAADICEMAMALGADGDDEPDEDDAGGPSDDDADNTVAMVGKALSDPDLIFSTLGSEIKALGDGDTIGGYAVLFGAPDMHDISAQRDYFDRNTDFWLKRFGWPRPITYHHGLDPDTADDPIVGEWKSARVDNVGVWLEGQLDKAHKYHGAVKELIKRGYLKLSSDSAPQWVQRERDMTTGANYVKRWPLITASTTVTPAEPRMMGLTLKALVADLGLNDIDDNPEADEPDDSDRHDGAKADDDRARRLLLEIDIIELETAHV